MSLLLRLRGVLAGDVMDIDAAHIESVLGHGEDGIVRDRRSFFGAEVGAGASGKPSQASPSCSKESVSRLMCSQAYHSWYAAPCSRHPAP